MSDIIVLYENGKAVGGEGHPTNADEITFNNEDTDLVSEEVESAIKEVNAKFDRGSVSVTADGVKTYATLFAELKTLVDTTKINKDTIFIMTSSNGNEHYLSLTDYYPVTGDYVFCETSGSANNTTNSIIVISDTTANNIYIIWTLATTGNTKNNYSTDVVTANTVFTIQY